MSTLVTILLLVILLLMVGFFTSSETAYLSLPKLKLRRMLEENKKHAKTVASLKEHMETLLTTVLIGTNFLNSFISALSTALVIKLFGGAGIGLPTFAVAFVITTFGQIIPKTIAGRNPEKVTCFSAVPLKILKTILFPIVWLFERLSHGAVWLTEKIMKPSSQTFDTQDLVTLIDVGENEGTIEKDESRMLNKLIQFNDITVNDIMKHRSFLSMVSSAATLQQVKEEFLKSGFSTITVYKDRIENVVGVINYKKVLTVSAGSNTGEGFAERIMSDVEYIPATLSVLELLQKFRNQESKFAVVLNEQGDTAGIVTMEDILRVVFGRMTDENAVHSLPAENRIHFVGNNTFIVPGDISLEDVNSILNLKLESEYMNSFGGWLLEKFGYLPESGSVLIYEKILFTVEAVSQRRIATVKVKSHIKE
ncbi:MAG: hemolysin family protein [Treponema sp.]|nr:hemolysin family protein [Treponema sp.]